jgi:hypothetical protein
MNPTLEVQIIAKIDKLDAGLKMAETKVNQSAQTMGKVGEQGGSMFVESMVKNMVKGLALGAVSNVLGGGILTALQGVHAGKGGEEIGLDIAKGIVDGAKGIPIVGTIVSIFDEIVNGANRAIEKLQTDISVAVKNYTDAWDKMKAAREGFLQGAQNKAEDVAVMDSPEGIIRLSAARQKEEARKAAADAAIAGNAEQNLALQQSQAAELERLRMEENYDIDQLNAVRKQQAAIRAVSEQRQADSAALVEEALAKKLIAIDEERDKKILANKTKVTDDSEALAKKAEAENKRNAIETGEEMIELFRAQQKEKYEAAMQAQEDIIDAEQAAQAQIDKVGRVDQIAGQAAQGMISSGQTALGQFNFAQAGAGGTALDMAKKQVMSLEKIEAATAEQVRLTKENKGFQ